MSILAAYQYLERKLEKKGGATQREQEFCYKKKNNYIFYQTAATPLLFRKDFCNVAMLQIRMLKEFGNRLSVF